METLVWLSLAQLNTNYFLKLFFDIDSSLQLDISFSNVQICLYFIILCIYYSGSQPFFSYVPPVEDVFQLKKMCNTQQFASNLSYIQFSL